MKTKTKDIILNMTNEDDPDGWFMLKGCEITSLELRRDSNGVMNVSAVLIATDYAPAEFKVKFKDKEDTILYKDYYDVKNQYGEPEEMTHEEFLDRLMALRI